MRRIIWFCGLLCIYYLYSVHLNLRSCVFCSFTEPYMWHTLCTLVTEARLWVSAELWWRFPQQLLLHRWFSNTTLKSSVRAFSLCSLSSFCTLTALEVECSLYHAGMPYEQRRKAHKDFVNDKVSVIIATVAFGMGIDKPDVRRVIHYGGMYVCISMITSISILQSAIYVSCLCFIRPVCLSRIPRAEKSDGQRGRLTLGCILGGPLIKHKLDTAGRAG